MTAEASWMEAWLDWLRGGGSSPSPKEQQLLVKIQFYFQEEKNLEIKKAKLLSLKWLIKADQQKTDWQ